MPARRSSCSATDRRGPVEAGAPGAYLKCFLRSQLSSRALRTTRRWLRISLDTGVENMWYMGKLYSAQSKMGWCQEIVIFIVTAY